MDALTAAGLACCDATGLIDVCARGIVDMGWLQSCPAMSCMGRRRGRVAALLNFDTTNLSGARSNMLESAVVQLDCKCMKILREFSAGCRYEVHVELVMHVAAACSSFQLGP